VTPLLAGKAHWEVLLRARAIETQVSLSIMTKSLLAEVCERAKQPDPSVIALPQAFMIAAAQAGRHNAKRESYGHALIVDPWGKIIAKLDDPHETGIAVAELDIEQLNAIRERIPINEHRELGRKCIVSANG
jgi:predicted amidohydrolase